MANRRICAIYDDGTSMSPSSGRINSINRRRIVSSDSANRPNTIIVTGASQGIGAGTVRAFLSRGYKVVANSRNITGSRAFEPSDKLALVDGNIADTATAVKITEVAKSKFGSIDALVNTAGIFFSKPF